MRLLNSVAPTLGAGVALLLLLALPALRALNKRGRSALAKWVAIATILGGTGVTLAAMHFYLEGMSEQEKYITVINNSGERLVLESTVTYGPGEPSYQSLRDGDSNIVRTDRDGRQFAHGPYCFQEQRLLRLDDGVDLQPKEPRPVNSPYYQELDPDDFDVVLDFPDHQCVDDLETWFEWNGTELREIDQPGIRLRTALLSLTAVAVLTALGRGLHTDRLEQSRTPPPPQTQTAL